MTPNLPRVVDAALVASLPAALKAAIDAALAKGGTKREILRRVRRQTTGLICLSCEAYLESR